MILVCRLILVFFQETHQKPATVFLAGLWLLFHRQTTQWVPLIIKMFCRAACEKPNDPTDPCICDNIAVAIDIEDNGKFLNSDAFFLLLHVQNAFWTDPNRFGWVQK